MANINKCIFIGNLTRDPETRTGNGGGTICNFTLAVNHKYKDQETVEFVRCVGFGKVGDIINQYSKKGDKLFVEGRMQTREWEKDGNKQRQTEIVVNEFQFLTSKKGNGGQDQAPF